MRQLRLLLHTVALLIAASIPSSAVTYFTFEGSCTEPGKPVVTQGILSTTPAQINHIPCQIQVFIHGTTNPPVGGLFSDDLGTPLSNPFNSQSNGYFHFEVSTAGEYDYVMSNTVTGPPTIPAWTSPFTVSGIQLGASGTGPGGGSPGGNTNDIQSNAGGGNFQGTGGLYQWNPITHTVTLSGIASFVGTGTTIDMSGMLHTAPFKVGTTAALLTTACTPGIGETAFATDAPNGNNIFPCAISGFFIQPTAILPSPPGVPGSFIMNNGGNFGFYAGLFWDPVLALLHAPGGLSLDSTKPFSLQGLCPTATPLGSGASGTLLFGPDVGCTPKMSVSGGSPLSVGLQSLIDYTYIKLDANNCFGIGPSTDDVGVMRFSTSVLGIMNCGNTTSPTKLNIVNTFTSNTNAEWVSLGFSALFNAYILTPDHGSLAGNYHPMYFGAAGVTNPFWAIQTVGPLTCLATNPSCDFGSLNTSQQIRNGWFAGFIAQNIIGPNYTVANTGVQVGLVATFAATSPTQVTTATTAQLTGTAGVVGYVTAGTIPSLTIVNGGSGYTGPSCQVSPPPINSGVTALCTVTQLAGVINSATITNIGSNSGYESIQSTTITITDANGSGAVLIPVITATTGFAGIAQNGSTLNPIFDGAVTIRDQIVGSIINPGQLHDSGFPCAQPWQSTVKVYGCSNFNSAGPAGTSVGMTINMKEATEYILQAITPSATTCPTAAPAGSLCKDTITLPTAFSDANYVSNCYPTAITTGIPSILAILPADKGAGSFKIQVTNITAVAAQVTSYDCGLRHK